ncbi:MAG: hypothetical protein U5J98_09015 [Halobacteriales archaeon]|nr:hypothetical protein [Halobacteriales archaeon]
MTGDVLLTDLPDEGCTFIRGPPISGKYDLLIDLLASSTEGAIVLSTKYSAARVIDDLHEAGYDPDAPLGIIDCATSAIDHNADVVASIKRVDGPENLSRIGVAFTELADTMSEQSAGDRVLVGIHSLGQLVVNNDIRSVYRFLQTLSGQVRSAGWREIVVMDVPVSPDEDGAILEHHADCVLDLIDGEAEHQLRIRGKQGQLKPASD